MKVHKSNASFMNVKLGHKPVYEFPLSSLSCSVSQYQSTFMQYALRCNLTRTYFRFTTIADNSGQPWCTHWRQKLRSIWETMHWRGSMSPLESPQKLSWPIINPLNICIPFAGWDSKAEGCVKVHDSLTITLLLSGRFKLHSLPDSTFQQQNQQIVLL